jgi:hypothetical protein
MLHRMSLRLLVAALSLTAVVSFAQDGSAKVVIVPSGDAFVDAGVEVPQTNVTIEAPPPTPEVFLVPPTPQPETRTVEAVTPLPPMPEKLDENPVKLEPSGPTAMIDGRPREGAFLSGPGSLTFIAHHTIMLGVGVLATQVIPRVGDSNCLNAGQNADNCVKDGTKATNGDARVAYLAGTLIGAGIGFGTAAFWQFNNWMSHSTANFGIINSLIGGMLLGGLTDLATHDATAISWLSLVGSTAGAWLTAIFAKGDFPLNKAALITSGAGWAMVYTALIIGIIVSTGGGSTIRGPIDALMIMPAVGAGAMLAASLKFNPSFAQIMRANVFGAVAGGAVLALSLLLISTSNPSSPVPYILGGVAAIGAKTIVSLLWAEAAENHADVTATNATPKFREIWW